MLKKEQVGLLVVDVQGTLANIVHESEALLTNTVRLIKGAQALNLPILCLEQNPDKLGNTTPVVFAALAGNKAISKYTFDGCESPEFVQALELSGVSQWLVCGIEAHICVYQSTLGLLRLGYEVELVSDCISSRTAFNKEIAISKLVKNGAQLTTVEMCLYELLGTCQAPEFKDILRLIK
ncbi:MAG: nicotinamidase-related amidase [Paraglaciecola sp.]|jgi:nicotinamidase-related amidase